MIETYFEIRDHARPVRMSPTFLIQDLEIEQSALLKYLLGVRWEEVGLFKTIYNIDIKTRHIP